MKKSIIALALLLCLGLSGCGEVLAGSYQTSAPHVDRPATDEDSSAIRVENYRDLVSAVLYLVSQGESEGTLQFYDYPGDVETAVTNACLEVATQDPLGAYCLDYIRHETTRVVSYDQATLSIHYRRTMEQVRSMVNVTGTSAIRTELREALGAFQKEVVLRVAYFAEDADSITRLIRQAYYDNPAHALGFPQVEINLYPDRGIQRVVEILLTYPEDVEELAQKSEALALALEETAFPGSGGAGEPADIQAAAIEAAKALREIAAYAPEGGATPYAALVEGKANSEGMALAYALYCKEMGLSCEIVEGTLLAPASPEETDPEGAGVLEGTELSRFWVSLRLSDGETYYLDPSAEQPAAVSGRDMFDQGYRWPGGPVEETVTEEGPEGEKTEEIQ
ncbi:MAG: hypothetical protein K2F83_02815 [Oscillospiraceae bacterium]|nr:hypothetical protein [Oscillospiraceae bacterium]